MHLVSRTPLVCIRGDSSLSAAGGYSLDLGFWWYLEWPPAMRTRTLHFQHDNNSNMLISINQLEYATILINYSAAIWYIQHTNSSDPYPVVRIESDNTASEAWSRHGCKDSLGGRTLSRIHSALLLGNWVGLQVACISTTNMPLLTASHASLTHLTSLVSSHPYSRTIQLFMVVNNSNRMPSLSRPLWTRYWHTPLLIQSH